jgi:hypothetical protein
MLKMFDRGKCDHFCGCFGVGVLLDAQFFFPCVTMTCAGLGNAQTCILNTGKMGQPARWRSEFSFCFVVPQFAPTRLEEVVCVTDPFLVCGGFVA